MFFLRIEKFFPVRCSVAARPVLKMVRGSRVDQGSADLLGASTTLVDPDRRRARRCSQTTGARTRLPGTTELGVAPGPHSSLLVGHVHGR